MYAVLLIWVWASTTCFQASQDAGGDVCCSPYLGLGLYYLLSGLAGCWGRCMLFSLSGSGPLLPAFRPRRMLGEMYAVLLVWVWASTTCFQASQDAGGDVCCSPCLGLGLYYLLSGLRRMLGEMYAVLLVWVWALLPAF